MNILAAGLSEEVQKQLAQAVEGAAGREPLTYLVLVFSIVVLLLIGLALRHVLAFIAERDRRDDERLQRHEANEAARMTQMQEIGVTCHRHQTQLTDRTSDMFDKFSDRLDENTVAVRTLIDSEARRLGS
jgi:hypothetical protein